GRPRARVPVPERTGGGAARARRRRAGVRAGRRRRLRDHRPRHRPREWHRRRRAAAARLRRVHARGGGPDGVRGAVTRGSRRRPRRDELPAACARPPPRVDRARRRPRLGRARTEARTRRCDRRSRLQRQHAAHERAALGRTAARVGGGLDRAPRYGDRPRRCVPERRRGARRAVPDAERIRGRTRGDLRARPRLAGAERAAARRARDGRRPQRRSRGRRVAAAACTRSRRRVVDPARAVGADARLSVGDIVDDVRARGDEALREWALRLDGVEPARATPEPGLPNAAVLALADRVRRWHEAQRPADLRLEVEPGVELERRWVPLRSVGVYVPRSLVSTLVMCAVPARVAGVERIVVVTPPAGAGLVAAAAELLGLDDVWAVGGAQAIAALAYGTESIRRVDKIIGPGNAFVNEAKLLVSRDVAIDLPAGP